MKVIIKTCKGANFEIEVVEPEDTVVEVKITESTEGADVYPAVQLRLIPQGKVLKDETKLEENKVAENSAFVVMTKPPSGGASTASAAPPTQTKPSSAGASVASAAPPTQGLPNAGADTLDFLRLINEREGNVLGDLASAVPQSVSVLTPEEEDEAIERREAMGFDRDTVLEGVPNPGADTLDFCSSLHFQTLRAKAQLDPQMLQPMFQILVKLNPRLMGFLQERHPDFLRLINEREGNVLGDLA